MSEKDNDKKKGAAAGANGNAKAPEVPAFLQADITIEDRTYGPQYPIVQWTNGDPSKKKEGGLAHHGGFFISAEQQLKIPGAEPHVLITREGEEIQGYAIRDLKGSAISFRRSWQVTPPKGLSQRFGNNEYDDALALGKPRGAAHVLFVPEGLDEPVVLTFRGFTARAMVGMAKDRGVIPMFGQLVVGGASRLARQGANPRKVNFPTCAFSLVIGPARGADGSPVYEDVGEGEATSKVTMPTWIDQPTGAVDASVINSRYVGAEKLARFQSFYTEAEEWVAEWSPEKLAARRSRTVKAAAHAPADGAASGAPGSHEMPF